MKIPFTSLQHATPTGVAFPGEEFARFTQQLLGGLFQFDRLSGMYNDIKAGPGVASFADRALAGLGVTYQVVHGEIQNIPRDGTLLVVANHPFGGVEGLVMLSLLNRIRSDVKLMATRVLSDIEELRPQMIMVDPFGGSAAATSNVAPLRQSLRWLRNGSTLGMFPAGEVAHYDMGERGVRESDWHPALARLVRHGQATVLPLYFEGTNGPLFQLAGLVHPRLRTAMLAREIVNKAGHSLKVRVGRPISFQKLEAIPDDGEMTRYLRMRVRVLGMVPCGATVKRAPHFRARRAQPVMAAGKSVLLEQEVAWLPPEQELVSSGDYRVYIAGAKQIPIVLREIARLREITFRAVGEGTGQALDMDVFDQGYQHLFVWNHKTSEVVGAYRLGLTDKILAQCGMKGLYTGTLFKYGWELIGSLDPAIEIGRSFVRQEYQKKHLPLLLLWKGIGQFVVRNPKYRKLFGTVSMSNRYSEVARQLVVGYYEQQKSQDGESRFVCPRKPMKVNPSLLHDRKTTPCRIPDLDALSEMISEIEPDGKGVPVLMRQYHKLGGRVLACNVDPSFNMALDALIVVDLCKTDLRLLELYMGEETQAYLDYHKRIGALT